MPTYYIDDGGDNSTGAAWESAFTSFKEMIDSNDGNGPGSAGAPLASGDFVYVGHNHVCPATHAATLTITGPTSGAPARIISATQGSDPPTYARSTTDQIDTTEGAYGCTFDGSFALYGLRVKTGTVDAILLNPDADEIGYGFEVTHAMTANRQFAILAAATTAKTVYEKLIVDLTGDGSSARTNEVFNFGSGNHVIRGLTFVNPGFRTGHVMRVATGSHGIDISGANFSGFTNGTNCELIGATLTISGPVRLSNCITKSGVTINAITTRLSGYDIVLTNVGPADAPGGLYMIQYGGDLESSAVYRTGGAMVEGEALSWKITTSATCYEEAPFVSQWIYGRIDTAGTYDFAVSIAHSAGDDLHNGQIWLTLEYLGTEDSPLVGLATNKRASPINAAVDHAADSGSTWNDLTPDYKQKLVIEDVAVAEPGLYRVRVGLGKSETTVYVDPKATVTASA
jgi:hypothetical protein